MHVRELMTKNPTCCTPDASIVEVARVMVELDCGALPVVGELTSRIPIGIITDRDIVTRAIAKGLDPMTCTVGDCMTAPAVVIAEEATLDECVEMLELGQIRRAIVVDTAGRCSGVVAQADIALHASKRETGALVHELSKRPEPVFAR